MPAASLNGLGLEQDALNEHIAVDIGSRATAILLAERLSASLVLGNYSRLVVDLNRDLDDPTAFIPESDGVVIPGNQALCADEKRQRSDSIFRPYHDAIENLIDGFLEQGTIPVMLSIHSFTPVLGNQRRPWHIGVLWDKDPRIALPLLEKLRQNRELVVGDNEPYSGHHHADYTVDHHGEGRGLANVSIELRQDLLRDMAGVERWAALLADALSGILTDETLYQYPVERVLELSERQHGGCGQDLAGGGHTAGDYDQGAYQRCDEPDPGVDHDFHVKDVFGK